MSFANNIALPCYGCHVSNNNKSNNSIPIIEGIDKKYFIIAFHEYKKKIRDNYLMQIISQGYTESEIENLAEYRRKFDIFNRYFFYCYFSFSYIYVVL